MLDRFVPVAGMLLSDDVHVSRARVLEARHRADLRLADDRPSRTVGLAARVIDRVRSLIAPTPVADPAPACCLA